MTLKKYIATGPSFGILTCPMNGRPSTIVFMTPRLIRKTITKLKACTMNKSSALFMLICVSLISCTSQPTPAMEWSCRNNFAEIACQGQDCTVALPGDYTPMELTFDSSGEINLCAYSGCWEGKAEKISTTGNYFSVIALELPWNGTGGGASDISATINMETAIATIITSDFAHPMSCKIV